MRTSRTQKILQKNPVGGGCRRTAELPLYPEKGGSAEEFRKAERAFKMVGRHVKSGSASNNPLRKPKMLSDMARILAVPVLKTMTEEFKTGSGAASSTARDGSIPKKAQSDAEEWYYPEEMALRSPGDH